MIDMPSRWRLTDLDLDFVSLVAAGDDPEAQVVLAKAEPDDVPTAEELAEAASSVEKKAEHKSSTHPDLDRSPKKNWVEEAGGLPKYIERIAKHLHFDRGMSISHAIASAINQCKKWAAGGEDVKPDTRAKAAKAIAEWEAKKAKAKTSKSEPDKSAGSGSPGSTLPADNSPEGSMSDDVISKNDLDPEIVQYIDALEAKVSDLGTEVETVKSEKAALEATVTDLQSTLEKSAPKDEESEKALLQASLAKMDPATRSVIEKQMRVAEEAQEIAKAERNARLEQVYLSKAEALPMISEDKSALAGLLRRISDALTPEDAEQVEKTLRAANEQISKGNLFSTFGQSGAQTTISKSVEAKAREIMKTDPALTLEQATVKVYENEPDLLQAALTGQEG